MTESSLAWDVKEEGGAAVVQLRGTINEDASFDALRRELGDRSIVRLDLGRIERINSVGVREWVNFMRSLQRCEAITLEACAPVVVAQINMISNFAGTATIKSVYAPYVCDSCGYEQASLIDPIPVGLPDLHPASCPSCGEETFEFDDLPESYFAFIIAGNSAD